MNVKRLRLWAAMAIFAIVTPAAARHAVFILGEDVSGEPAFYAPAEAYYRARAAQSDRSLVMAARSLQQVREILQTSGDGRWDSVTLVVHGSPWEGANVDVYADGERALIQTLRRAADSGSFPPVSDDRIDATTQLRLDSCGLGRRRDYLDALARLFGGDDRQRPQVVASPHFVAYARSGTALEWSDYRRLELPMVSRVLPVPPTRLDPARLERQIAAMRKMLDAEWAGAGASPRWKSTPVRVHSDVPVSLIDGRTPAQFAAIDIGVRDTLRAHGLDHRALQWSWGESSADSSSRTLLGEGTLILMHANPVWGLDAVIAAK